MRILIAISSCGDFESNGNNQALRDTWLKDAMALGVPYKFFFGIGQGEPELPDSVILREVPDDYGHLTYKTRASLRWAHEKGYDFVFRCFPDTYVRVDRLMGCGFQQHDYHGDFGRGGRVGSAAGGSDASLGSVGDTYASGGAGYWLSRKAFELLLNEPITGIGRDEITPYAEDIWVGNRLGRRPCPLEFFNDRRFENEGSYNWPSQENQLITAHMSYPDRYHKSSMYSAHEAWR